MPVCAEFVAQGIGRRTTVFCVPGFHGRDRRPPASLKSRLFQHVKFGYDRSVRGSFDDDIDGDNNDRIKMKLKG